MNIWQVQFDVDMTGGQYACMDAYAEGILDSVNVTLTYFRYIVLPILTCL